MRGKVTSRISINARRSRLKVARHTTLTRNTRRYMRAASRFVHEARAVIRFRGMRPSPEPCWPQSSAHNASDGRLVASRTKKRWMRRPPAPTQIVPREAAETRTIRSRRQRLRSLELRATFPQLHWSGCEFSGRLARVVSFGISAVGWGKLRMRLKRDRVVWRAPTHYYATVHLTVP